MRTFVSGVGVGVICTLLLVTAWLAGEGAKRQRAVEVGRRLVFPRPSVGEAMLERVGRDEGKVLLRELPLLPAK